MTRMVYVNLCAIVFGIAATAAAQEVPSRTGGIVGIDTATLAAATAPAPALLAQSRSQSPRPASVRRRRGTFVGYIDDALTESNLRIRFDTATGNTVPDRAEFFYAKCGCYKGLIGSPALDAEAPGPGGGAANDINFQQLYLEGEYEVTPQVSVLGQVPLRWLQPQSFIPGTGAPFDDQSGLGDIRVGAKLAFVDTPTAVASTKVQFYFPTGNASNGLGTDHYSVEPSVLFWNELTPMLTLESQLGVWLPIGGANPVPTSADGHFAGRVFYYGIGPSFAVYDQGRTRIAPVVELVGWHVMSGYQTAATSDASGTDIVNLKIGARIGVGGGSFYGGWGKALTDAVWYDDIVRFEYRYSF